MIEFTGMGPNLRSGGLISVLEQLDIKSDDNLAGGGLWN
jgi:hypothetical protein